MTEQQRDGRNMFFAFLTLLVGLWGINTLFGKGGCSSKEQHYLCPVCGKTSTIVEAEPSNDNFCKGDGYNTHQKVKMSYAYTVEK